MAEDISAQARVGVTVMALAALVAVVLNIMVIAQSIVSSGMGTLQAGVDAIKMQEYEAFNNKKVTGVQVKTALTLYITRDNAVVIGTKNSIANGKWYVYGSLLDGCQKESLGSSGGDMYYIPKATFDESAHQISGQPYALFEYKLESNGTIARYTDTKKVSENGADQYVEESGTFLAQIIKNKTNTIVGIKFTQESR